VSREIGKDFRPFMLFEINLRGYPDGRQGVEYKIINHCRWNRLRDVVPSLLFKPSFRTFVLANFVANATAAISALYRRA
jgi:hypothetical protein